MSVDSMVGRRMVLWTCAQWTLFAIWVSAAALGMAHIRAGFLTSYAADLTIPAWLYIVQLTAKSSSRMNPARILAGAPPLVVAASLFLASVATEVSQAFWPRGVFRGTFDPLDIAAYATGLAVCLAADLLWPISSSRSADELPA